MMDATRIIAIFDSGEAIASASGADNRHGGTYTKAAAEIASDIVLPSIVVSVAVD